MFGKKYVGFENCILRTYNRNNNDIITVVQLLVLAQYKKIKSIITILYKK